MTQKSAFAAKMSEHLAKARQAEDAIFAAAHARFDEYCAAADAALEHMAKLGFTAKSLHDAATEFGRLGVAAPSFKTAVAAVRRLLFDDESRLFRDVYCCGMRGPVMQVDDASADFLFQYAPTGMSFAIEVDLRAEYDYFSARRGGLMAPPPIMSGFRLVHPESFCRLSTVASGPDEEQMKKEVVAYAERGFRPDPAGTPMQEARPCIYDILAQWGQLWEHPVDFRFFNMEDKRLWID